MPLSAGAWTMDRGSLGRAVWDGAVLCSLPLGSSRSQEGSLLGTHLVTGSTTPPAPKSQCWNHRARWERAPHRPAGAHRVFLQPQSSIPAELLSPNRAAASLPGLSALGQAGSSSGARMCRDAPVSHSPGEVHGAEHWHPPGSCQDVREGLPKGEREGGLSRPSSALRHVPSFGRN